jgi:hypothetical protein
LFSRLTGYEFVRPTRTGSASAAPGASLLDLDTVCTQSTVLRRMEPGAGAEAEAEAEWHERFVFAVAAPPMLTGSGSVTGTAPALQLRVELLDLSDRSATGRVMARGVVAVRPGELPTHGAPLPVSVPLEHHHDDDGGGGCGSLALELYGAGAHGAAVTAAAAGGNAAAQLASPTPVALSAVGPWCALDHELRVQRSSKVRSPRAVVSSGGERERERERELSPRRRHHAPSVQQEVVHRKMYTARMTSHSKPVPTTPKSRRR